MELPVARGLTVAEAQAEFAADAIFLNTATLGLPPRRTLDALRHTLDLWASGRADAVAYDIPVARARTTYAGLVGVAPEFVAVGGQVSVFSGLIAASLADNAEVLTASGDFTSVVFPFHVQASRGVTVREVPLDELADSISEQTTLVAVSAVQSADGRVADIDGLVRACAATGTRIMLDLTQANGWLPIDAGRVAYTVCGGYKWLLNPRGTAFMTVQRDLLDDITPHTAGWYAGGDRWNSIYGAPLRLSGDARRFDISPAWFSWVGAATSLDLLHEVGIDVLHAHDVGLANRFRAGVGMAPSNSAIVSAVADPEVPALMRAANIIGVTRAGRLRLSFHISTTEQDVDTAIEVLAGHVAL
ncbi:MAG: aminotransferase class V-fold PLP-dependent enzyme [Candidatus Dormiibacterota bacterium]